jgi:excisionase family DNA binding protein
MEQQILVAEEVAEMLRVDRQRVYELVRRSAIPVIRLGERQYRFDAEAIRQWIEHGGSVAIHKGEQTLQ